MGSANSYSQSGRSPVEGQERRRCATFRQLRGHQDSEYDLLATGYACATEIGIEAGD